MSDQGQGPKAPESPLTTASTFQLSVPHILKALESQPGKHRAGIKSIWYGPSKTGKSWALASFPHPILCASCGERGIEMYLQPSLGDKCFEISSPKEFEAFIMDLALPNEQHFASLVTDNHNLLWDDWMDAHETKFGGEIKGSQWRFVKGPWKTLHRKIMKMKCHFGASAWIKDILYTEEPAPPGERGKIQIVAQDNPQVEKTIPYIADLIFRTGVQRDRLNRPNGKHEVVFYGGRRPRSVPPTELYVGKTWIFDAKAPVSVWDTVVAPFYQKWTEGAVDHLGVDAQEAEETIRDLHNVEQDEVLGRCQRLIQEAKTLIELKATFSTYIQPETFGMDQFRKDLVKTYLEARKKQLGG